MSRITYIGSVVVFAWLAFFTSAFADSPVAPASTREPPVAAVRSGSGDVPDEADAPVDPAALIPARNALFVEVLGPGVAFSLNYERTFFSQVAVRAGFAPWLWKLWTVEPKLDFAVPLTIAYVGLPGFEAGGGVTFLSDRDPIVNTLVGYRLHPRGGAGFQFRAGGMVLVAKDIWHGGDVMPFLYLSAGAGF